MKSRKVALVLLLLALVVVAPAAAQQKALTWLGFSTVNTGMMDQAVQYVLEDREFYDGLMADGVILGWGVATRVTHLPDDPNNFVHWVTLPGWEHVDRWVGAFSQVLMSRSLEERADLEERFTNIFAPGSHSDVVAHDMSWQGSGETPPRYVYVGEFHAHPGQGGNWVEVYKTLVPPIGQKLMGEGLVTGFGLHTPSLHTGDGWTHTTYMLFTGLEGIDRYQQEFEAAFTPEVAGKAITTYDVARHRDSVWMILHNGGTPVESDEGGGG